MAYDALNSQERRELFEEYRAHLMAGELGPISFQGKCIDAGIDRDDINEAIAVWRAKDDRLL